jgi:hypothetical protein
VGADLVCLGRAEVGVEGQGPVVVLARLVGVAGGTVGVAEAGVGAGLLVGVVGVGVGGGVGGDGEGDGVVGAGVGPRLGTRFGWTKRGRIRTAFSLFRGRM